MSAAPVAIIEEIVDQYFEDASFLWAEREAAKKAVNHTLYDLAFLDGRIEALVDGLRVAGDDGWDLCEAGLDPEDPGTVFTASVIAFESGDEERMDLVVEASGESRTAFRAVVSALGWMDVKRFNALIIGFVSNKSRPYRRLGIAACGIRRLNPKTYLDQALNSSDMFLRARALKAVGQLKRIDLLPQLQIHLQHENHDCRFEAARSALLLGDKSALDTLSAFILSPSKYMLPAMQVALRLADNQVAQAWLKNLSKDPEQRRQMLIGTGITGNPGYIPMLLKVMRTHALARAAGNAFAMITGINLAEEGLEGPWPDGFEVGPNDDPEDENTEMDPDEDLPWPNVESLAHWWAQNMQRFEAGSRYLCGLPISNEHCALVLKTGMQPSRNAAALELALSEAATPYFNTSASGPEQIKRL